MDVPIRLTRSDDPPAAADAVLLFADGFDRLAAAGERLGGAPVVHRVRGGFLLLVDGKTRSVPGSMRLRRVAGDLFIPADAVLLPRLLSDEVTALTRDRGLVVLPGGEVLSFDPQQPLGIGEWLAPARVRREDWEPFPPRPDGADRLTVIERPAPPVEVLTGPDDADPLPGSGKHGPIPEDARPPAGSALGRAAAGAELGLGKFLAWVAKAVRAPGLAKLGADLARRAVERAPRITERLLGAQEAALREVLRQLQSGDVEKALRRAPVAVPDPDAPARIGTNANLGYRDPRYSLRDLVSSGGTGPAWLGGGDVWQQLANEYRRLAREAAARGDYRRAAYIHGVLLRDLRSAANALMAGGLYRDAAVLLRDRIRDEAAAATAFEQAGDYDEAGRLYEKLGQYEQAGDLLRRIGEEDRAAGYFRRAAYLLVGRGQHLAAGDLVRRKLGDEELAGRYYRMGWEADKAEAGTCGERLLDQFLAAEAWPEVKRLAGEAEERFAPPRSKEAGRFFNYLMQAGEVYLPADLQDDLADRARLLFAAHLRPYAGPSKIADKMVGELFAPGAPWPGPVVRDAAFAVRGPVRRPAAPPMHEPPVRLADGTVTAVVLARGSGDLFVATRGAVVCWRAGGGQLLHVFDTGDRRVLALSTDPSGRTVYALYEDDEDVVLRCFTSTGPGPFQSMGQVLFRDVDRDGWHLQPSAETWSGEPAVTLAGPSGRTAYLTPYLVASSPREEFSRDVRGTRLLVVWWDVVWDWDELFLRCRTGVDPVSRWVVPWAPAVPPNSPLAAPPVDWITPASRVLEVVGVNADGTLYWSEFDGRTPAAPKSRTVCAGHGDGYLAGCLLGPGLVAGATGRNEVHWFRATGTRLEPMSSPVTVSGPARVVFLAARGRGSVTAVLADGSTVRVPGP